MKKQLNVFVFVALAFTGLLFNSCEKASLVEEDVTSNSLKEPVFVEPSEEVINGELFVDGISQKEVITDFNIKGVKVVEGRLAFDDHEAMLNAIDELEEYNTESVVAWSSKIGFTSLFTELTRIEERSVDEMQQELDNGDMYNEYFHITGEGELNLTKHTILLSRIFNTQGLIQVGSYVGIMVPGLTVWVEADKTEKLVNALKNRTIPDNDRDFIIVDKSAFDNTRNWIALESCPKGTTWIGPWHQYKNPDMNRRIEVKNSFHVFITPVNQFPTGMLFNKSYQYRIETVSKKASWNKYKTNHYLSIDIKGRKEYHGGVTPPGPIIHKTATEQDSNTKYGFISVSLPPIWNSLGLDNMVLLETIPGTSGLTGTSASHRGMSGRYARQMCN